MNRMYNKDTLSFYLVAFASAIAAVAAMCASAFWRATGGVATGFALFLPALVLACLGFSYPSPLNKVRCAAMLGNTMTLCLLYTCLFIASDLAGVKIVLYTLAGVFQPNIMGVLLTVFMGFGLLAAVMTATRVIMQTFGKSLNDLERQLYVQSLSAENEGSGEVITPREMDKGQVLAKADQDVRMNRMSIMPASPEGQQPSRSVTPAEARVRSQARKETERKEAERKEAERREAEAVVPTETPEAVDAAEEMILSEVETPEAEPAEETPVMRSILDVEEAPEAVPVAESLEEDDGVIYAQSDDVDDTPTVEVELARGEDLTDNDIRTETAVHRPRQKEMPTHDDLYTDFSYDDTDPSDPHG